MNKTAGYTDESILPCFFKTCQDAFAFMREKHGFRQISGLVEYKNGRQIIRTNFDIDQNIDKPGIVRLELGSTAITLGYENDTIDAYVYYGFTDRFSISDVLRASKKEMTGLPEPTVITCESHLKEYITNLADLFKKHAKIFSDLKPRLIERANTIKSKSIEQAIYKQLESNMDRAIRQAAKAFQKKDYKRVIELYRPFLDFLQTSDRKKYDLAQRYLTET